MCVFMYLFIFELVYLKRLGQWAQYFSVVAGESATGGKKEVKTRENQSKEKFSDKGVGRMGEDRGTPSLES